MILGCDAAGLDEDGNEVVVHAVISDPAWTRRRDPRPEAVAAQRALPGHVRRQGRRCPRAQRGARSRPRCSFEEAACLPTAWLTAYRMLFTQGGLKPGDTRAGAGRRRRRRHRADHAGPGRRAAGAARPAATRPSAQRALELGAHEVFESDARLPGKVDAVMETVGRATWSHSIRSLRPGGTLVISGTTSGPNARRRRADPDLLPPAAGDRLDDGHPRRAGVAGRAARRDRRAPASSTGCCRWSRPRDGFAAMADGDVFGKIVFTR